MKLCRKCGGDEKDARNRCRACHTRRNRAHVVRKMSSGKCVNCAAVAETGKKFCGDCRIRRSKAEAASVQAKKLKGQCISCSERAEDGRIRCRGCLDKKKIQQTKFYDDKRDRRECRNCPAKAEIGKTQCARCSRNNINNHTRYLAENECGRIAAALRNRLGSALKRKTRSGSAVRDLGCTIPELRQYLEAKFQPGMTWANWSMGGWHIDHIRPLASFDLTDRQQFLQAVHYTNLQPLWAEDNLHKSDKVA